MYIYTYVHPPLIASRVGVKIDDKIMRGMWA